MSAIAQRPCTSNYGYFPVLRGAKVPHVYFIQSKLLDPRLYIYIHPLKKGGTLKIINGSLIIRFFFLFFMLCRLFSLNRSISFSQENRKKAEYTYVNTLEMQSKLSLDILVHESGQYIKQKYRNGDYSSFYQLS